MKKPINVWVNKKNVLLFSTFVSLILIMWDSIGNYKLCDVLASSTGECPRIFAGIEVSLTGFFALFLFSLVTYFLNDEVFKTWIRFTLIWLPASIVLSLITPNDYASFTGSSKGLTSIRLAFLFSIISILIILVRLIQLRLKKSK